MSNKTNRKIIRDTAREAAVLFRKAEIDKEDLRTVLASALAWEITNDLNEKSQKKEKKLEQKL
jgi:hypothetical protein